MMKGLKHFLLDEDGMSARDFLMLAFTGVYLIQQVICFILALTGHLPDQAVDIMKSLDTVVITIIGAVFSVTVVQEIRKPKPEEKITIEAAEYQDPPYQTGAG